MLRDRLKKYGYRVLIFSDPARAIKRFVDDDRQSADCVMFCAEHLADEADTAEMGGDEQHAAPVRPRRLQDANRSDDVHLGVEGRRGNRQSNVHLCGVMTDDVGPLRQALLHPLDVGDGLLLEQCDRVGPGAVGVWPRPSPKLKCSTLSAQ